VGKHGGPGTVSSGKGDKGGVSYGTYQLSQHTVPAFVKQHYPTEFKGLTPGSKEFTQKWQQLAQQRGAEFAAKQHDFIKATHYDPAARKIKDTTKLDLTTRSSALQNVVWSTAVQHGAGGAASLVRDALGSQTKNNTVAKTSDAEIIRGIYAERGRKDANGALVHFKGNSKEVQDGVARRFQREQEDALNELAREQQGAAVRR
jgi:hypothetical protein